MVQSVYSVEELNVLLKEEEDILDEIDQYKQSNLDATNEVNEEEMVQMLEKLEHSQEKQQLIIQNELKNDDKMEVLAERLAKIKTLEEKLQQLRERQEVSVNGTVDIITPMLPMLHTLCIGPGLGRHPLVFNSVEKVIKKAMELNLALVLDADALFMLSMKQYTSLFAELRDYEKCVMTPNVMEMRRLNDALSSSLGTADDGINGENNNNNIIVQKGNIDTVRNIHHVMHCEEEGGLKRSGGIGDVLAGTISAFMAWNTLLETDSDREDTNSKQRQRVFACWTACVAVKKATKLSYGKKRRSMAALDVMGEIGTVLDDIEQSLV